jgi:RNA polymerase-binding transcription factor DksA
MTVSTTTRGQPVRGNPLHDDDACALRAILQEHHRARTDQIEALLWRYGDAGVAAGEAEARELVVARIVLADIDEALRRLDDGSYGWCVRCCEPIGIDRLYAAPRTLLCIGCALEQ